MLSVIGGAAVFPLASRAYLGVTGSIATAFYDTIVFPLRHNSDIEIVSFGAFAAPHQLPAVVFYPDHVPARCVRSRRRAACSSTRPRRGSRRSRRS